MTFQILRFVVLLERPRAGTSLIAHCCALDSQLRTIMASSWLKLPRYVYTTCATQAACPEIHIQNSRRHVATLPCFTQTDSAMRQGAAFPSFFQKLSGISHVPLAWPEINCCSRAQQVEPNQNSLNHATQKTQYTKLIRVQPLQPVMMSAHIP